MTEDKRTCAMHGLLCKHPDMLRDFFVRVYDANCRTTTELADYIWLCPMGVQEFTLGIRKLLSQKEKT